MENKYEELLVLISEMLSEGNKEAEIEELKKELNNL